MLALILILMNCTFIKPEIHFGLAVQTDLQYASLSVREREKALVKLEADTDWKQSSSALAAGVSLNVEPMCFFCVSVSK